ncbi:MAG: galactokinase [Gemmatimonadota bacterium]|nr:MAG: galactokinase [Gemmatimonadota bacterium]
MSTTEPAKELTPLELARTAFEKAFEHRPDFLSRAPGRVNLMGGHVDYNDGLVLPVAVDLEVAVAFTPRDDRHIRIYAESFDETAEFDISELTPGSVGGWAAYPAGVAWAIAKADLPLSGLDAAVASNIPIGSGLSSSAALEVAFAAAFRQVSGLELPELKLAQLSQAAENNFVGVQCGIMDQVAAACALPGKALLLDCRTLGIRHVALPSGVRIVVLGTGIERQLRDSEYNERRRECAEAVKRLSAVDNDIRSLRDVEAEALQSLLRHLPPPLDRRARHVVGEIERVQLAAAALEASETERFGELMFASHRSLRDDFQVSSDELDGLVELARQAPGTVGARLTGAGFGGCTVNLATAALVDDFLDYVMENYHRLYGREADEFITDAARGVTVEKVGW